MSQHKHERSDARRNREIVIDAAMGVIATEPNASMATIAEHSGLGRTTVYRHFATRDELIKAIVERAISEAAEATSEVLSRQLSTRETLLALGPAIIGIPFRFSYLAGTRGIEGDVILKKSALDPAQPIRRFISAAQERGEIDPDLPTQLVLAAISALTTGLATEIHAERLTADRAGALLGTMLVKLLLTMDKATTE